MAIKQQYSIIIISVLLSCITFKSNHVNRHDYYTWLAGTYFSNPSPGKYDKRP